MSDLASLFPPGTDLCLYPSAAAPPGATYTLGGGPSLVPLTIALTIILTVLAVVITAGRLYANLRKTGGRPSVADVLVFFGVLFNITEGGLMITGAREFRHMWNVPLCWITTQGLVISFLWEVINNLGLLCSKTATLLLFYQVFTVSNRMRRAIQFGIVWNAVLYLLGISILSYFSAPHVGEGWLASQMTMIVGGGARQAVRADWTVIQGALGSAWDVYVFVLPLPVVLRLNFVNGARKVQVGAVFFTAFL
jgi:hypothetical protein